MTETTLRDQLSKPRWSSARRLVSAGGLLSLVLLLSPPVHATLPGSNGLIAFTSSRDGDEEIVVASADGTDAKQLTSNQASDTDASWHPFGARIAFASNRDGDFEIFTMNADGSAVSQVTQNTADDRDPAWSPDAKTIAFASNRDGDFELLSTAADARRGAQTQLTDNVFDDREPDWSPDGATIAFTSNRDGDDEIFVMKANGSLEAQVTDNTSSDAQPSWSPTAETIAFTSNRDGDREIFAMSPEGGRSVAQLTENAWEDRDPVWSPDSQKVAFASNRSGAFEIFRMSAAGAGEVPLVEDWPGSTLPSWTRSFVIKPQPQEARNVKVEQHGHFMVVEFDQRHATDKPRVELWRGDEVKLQIASGPAAKHWKIKVTHLQQYTAYKLRIVMNTPSGGKVTYKHPYKVKTRQRQVRVTFRWVKVHEDGDSNDCGEFEFDFMASDASFTWSGTNYVRFPSTSADDQFRDICDDSSWDPKNKSLQLHDVDGDTVRIQVVGVDEDQTYLEVPYTCNNFAGCKGLGEWAAGSRLLDLVPKEFTPEAETFDQFVKIHAGFGDGIDGNPRFTWHIRYFVEYVLLQ